MESSGTELSERRSPKGVLWTVVRVGLAVALLTYLTRYGGLDWSALARLGSEWPLTLLAFALVLCAVVGTSWRLIVLLRPRGLDMTLAGSIRLTLIGMFFSTVLPGAAGGDLVRFYYGARDHGGRRAEIVTVMLLDRICGLAGLVIWPLVAAVFFVSLWWGNPVLTGLLGAGAVSAVALAAAFAVAWSGLARDDGPLGRWVVRFPMGSMVWTAIRTIASYRDHLTRVLAAVGISLGVHTVGIGVALLVARITNPEGFDWAMSVLIPMGFMANTVPLTPGGLGVGEAVFDTLFGLAGLEGGAEVILGWRLLVLASGLLGLWAYLSGRRDFVLSEQGAVGRAEP